MAYVRINPELKERDFETVYFGSVPYTIEKAFKGYDFDFVRHLFIENYKRKLDSGSDYYHFQFDSTEEAKINDIIIELKQGEHLDKPKPKKEVKEVSIDKKEETLDIPIVKKVIKTIKGKYSRRKKK